MEFVESSSGGRLMDEQLSSHHRDTLEKIFRQSHQRQYRLA